MRESTVKWLAVAGAAVIAIGMSGCKKTDTVEYVIPTAIYSVNLEKEKFVPVEVKLNDQLETNKIPAGTPLCQDDFKLRINATRTLVLGAEVNCSGLKKVKEYEYANGTVTEYMEETGNYKILVTEVDEKQYLMAVLTISPYITTGRGISNGMDSDSLFREMKDIPVKSSADGEQVNHVYSMGEYSLILNLKYDVIRSIQMILNNY